MWVGHKSCVGWPQKLRGLATSWKGSLVTFFSSSRRIAMDAANDTAERLYGPEKEDALINKLFIEGRGRDWQPLDEDNWQEQLQSVPLFMQRAPSRDEIESNPTMQAIQSLIYDGTPEECALNFKQQGDEVVKSKQKSHYAHAVSYYDKALGQRCQDTVLVARVLLNRAYVNLELENYRSVMTDCTRVLKMTQLSAWMMNQGQGLNEKSSECVSVAAEKVPDAKPQEDAAKIRRDLRCKALFRLTKALLALNRLEDVAGVLPLMLDMDTALHATLQEEFSRKSKQQQLVDAKKAHHLEKQHEKHQRYLQALEQAQICTLKGKDALHHLFPLPPAFTYRPSVEDDGSLVFPVVVWYPRLCMYDVIQAWHQDVKVKDMLAEILTEDRQMQDEDGFAYAAVNQLAVYQWSGNGWTRVRLLGGLKEALQGRLDEDGVVRLWVVPKPEGPSAAHQWTRDWLAGPLPTAKGN